MGRVNGTGIPAPAPLTGVAAGVPYVALRPARGRRRAPCVVAWHQLDPPLTGPAIAAPLPLAPLAAPRAVPRPPMTRRPGPDGVARLRGPDGAGAAVPACVRQ